MKAQSPMGPSNATRHEKSRVKTSPKLDIAAEGILLGKGTAWVKVLPGALRVIAPEPGAGAEKPLEKTAGVCLNLFPRSPSNYLHIGV